MPWDEAVVEEHAAKQNMQHDGRIISYTEALHEAIEIKMRDNNNVILCGQGVNDPAGMLGVSKELHKTFGTERVFDTPVAEESMTGICTGAAMYGIRPIYMHNRPDFILLAFNQLVTHASKMHFLDDGQTNVPLVIWSAIARGWGSGSQHSQAIQGMLMCVPGLKMIMPSTPYDAKGLMISAIEDNNPVLIFEHRWNMKLQGVVPEGYYKVPIGKACIRQEGNDLTIAGTSQALHLAIEAMEQLKDKYSADIIDLRTVKPLDTDTIIQSVKKTGRLLIVETGYAMGGVCAEIGCQIAERALTHLKAPIKRLGWPDAPVAAGDVYEKAYYPDINDTIQAIETVCKE